MFDVSHQDAEMVVAEFKLKYLKAQKDNVNTAFFIWYGGHGVLFRTSTHMVLNEKDIKLRYFPLETHLNQFSNARNTYTFVFQDNCRSLLKLEELEEAFRGGMNEEPAV